MKNGWYTVEYKDTTERVYVEDDKIVESKDEWGEPQDPTKCVVTEDFKKRMIKMEFDGMGVS